MLRQTNYLTCTLDCKINFNIFLQCTSKIYQEVSYLPVFKKKKKKSPCLSLSMRATFSSQLAVLEMITLKLFGDDDKWWRSLVVAVVPDHLDFVLYSDGFGFNLQFFSPSTVTKWQHFQSSNNGRQSLMSLLHSRYLKLPEKAALW